MDISDLKKGQAAIVKSLGNSRMAARLNEIGIYPGVQIKVKHVAPLGDPIAIQIASSTFALRRAVAQSIEIEI